MSINKAEALSESRATGLKLERIVLLLLLHKKNYEKQ